MTAKSKAELMRKTRKRRKEQGLAEFRAWVTPEQKKRLERLVKESNQ